MHSIDPQTKTAKENYKFLIGSVIPRPIAFVTSKSPDGTLNGAPFSYFNIVSADPPMISLSIQRSGSNKKDTTHNILETKEFVVHIVDEENVEKINQTAATLLPNENEVELAELSTIQSTQISVPGIQEAKVRMECIFEQSLELGEANNPSCDLIIGRIVHYHIAEDIYEDGKIDPFKLSAVSLLAGNEYAKLGEIFTKERPK